MQWGTTSNTLSVTFARAFSATPYLVLPQMQQTGKEEFWGIDILATNITTKGFTYANQASYTRKYIAIGIS